jgi:hypothetical protein
MLDEYFVSSSTLHRNERVKLAAMFWNIVGAGMLIGGVAGAFFFEGPLFWGKVGIAVTVIPDRFSFGMVISPNVVSVGSMRPVRNNAKHDKHRSQHPCDQSQVSTS